MIKKLLIGASALAFATVAHAQQIDPRAQNSAIDVNVGFQSNVPVQINPDTQILWWTVPGVDEVKNVREAADDLHTGINGGKPGNSAINAAQGDVLEAYNTNEKGHGAIYIDAVAGNGGVTALSVAGDKAFLDQDGSDNNGQIDQAGSTAGWAAINQDGNRARAYVDQNNSNNPSGSVNAAFIQQVSATNTNSLTNNAEIRQTAVTGATRTQYASIVQGNLGVNGNQIANSANASFGNSARIDQLGTSGAGRYQDAVIAQGVGAPAGNQNNEAYIRQGQNNNTATSNQAAIQQRTDGDAGIYQNGSQNRGFILQGTGESLTADIIQTTGASDNFASIYQSASATSELKSVVEQKNGSGNSAFVTQTGATWDATAHILQNGSNNLGVVTQTGASNNYALVSQTGGNNYGSVQQ